MTSEKRQVDWESIVTLSEAARQVDRNQSVVHRMKDHIKFPDGSPAWYKVGRTIYVHLPTVRKYVKENAIHKR